MMRSGQNAVKQEPHGRASWRLGKNYPAHQPKQRWISEAPRGGALAPGDDKRTGELLALAKTDEVIDAHLVLGIDDGDRVVASDPGAINHLLEARGVDAIVIAT